MSDGTQRGGSRSVGASIAFLTSKSGRIYLGCDIPPSAVNPYVRQLAAEEPGDFETLRKNQSTRDRGRYHVTVVSPPEFESIAGGLPDDIVGEDVCLKLTGLGKALWNGQRSFFVVVECDRVSDIRRTLGLGHRDLHVTLGFDREDVHGISKDHTTLL